MAERFRERLGPRRRANLGHIWNTFVSELDQWLSQLHNIPLGEPSYFDVFGTIADCSSVCIQYTDPKILELKIQALQELHEEEPEKEIGDLPHTKYDSFRSLIKEANELGSATSMEFMSNGTSDTLSDLIKKIEQIWALARLFKEDSSAACSEEGSMELFEPTNILAGKDSQRPTTPDDKVSSRKRGVQSPLLGPPEKRSRPDLA